MGIHGNVGVGMSGMCEGHSVGIMVWGIWPILNSVSVLLPPCTDPEPVRREAQAYPASPVRGAAGEQRGWGGRRRRRWGGGRLERAGQHDAGHVQLGRRALLAAGRDPGTGDRAEHSGRAAQVSDSVTGRAADMWTLQ